MTRRSQNRWHHFSLLSLLIFMALVCMAFGWLRMKSESARNQRDAAAAIVASGGFVRYHYQNDGPFVDPDGTPKAPAWLRNLFGDDMFASVTWVYLESSCDDGMLVQMKHFPQLQTLYVETEATDHGVRQLRELRELRHIYLQGPEITDDGILALSEIRSLEYVSLKSCSSITPEGLEALHRLPKLQSLDLYDTPVNDSWLGHLKQFRNLKTMCLRATPLDSDQIKELKQALPGVEFN